MQREKKVGPVSANVSFIALSLLKGQMLRVVLIFSAVFLPWGLPSPCGLRSEPAAAGNITRHQQYAAVWRAELMGPASLHRTSEVLLHLGERLQKR